MASAVALSLVARFPETGDTFEVAKFEGSDKVEEEDKLRGGITSELWLGTDVKIGEFVKLTAALEFGE